MSGRTMKKRLRNLLVVLVVGCVVWWWQCHSVFTISKQENTLRNEIRRQLEYLSADFSEQLVTVPPPLLPPKLSKCSVTVSVRSACLDTIEKPIAPPRCPLRSLCQDCDLLTQLHGYDKVPDDEEKGFPLAFGMKMHRNAEQAEQLLRAIYRPHNIYCIHVDNKTDRATFSTMESLARCFPNVFLTKRLNVVYGGPLMVEAELVLMNCALESPVPWKYYLNLAGQEFPLRTNLEMVRILQMLNGSNDIKSVPMPKHLRSRIDRVYVIRNGRIVRTFRHKDTPNTPHLQVRKGTQYGAFSRDFVTSLFVEDVARTIISYFADTYSSDETVWATINGYPGMPGGYPVNVTHSHLSRTIVWQSSNLYKCRGRYVHGICVFSKQDLPWLLKQPNLIANKFGGWADSYQAARCLEAVLDQRARSRGDTVNQSYVRNSPHVRFRDKVLQEA